jgi:L-asparagine transporter-like permease
MMFSLARAGLAPRPFAALSARGVPLNSLLLSSSGIALATLLSVVAPQASFIMMVAISSFGALFTWMMIFVTHYYFRRARAGAPPLSFRMIGYPATTLLGAGLMAAVLVTTYLTPEFHLTLVSGVPFLAALVLVYLVWFRRS